MRRATIILAAAMACLVVAMAAPQGDKEDAEFESADAHGSNNDDDNHGNKDHGSGNSDSHGNNPDHHNSNNHDNPDDHDSNSGGGHNSDRNLELAGEHLGDHLGGSAEHRAEDGSSSSSSSDHNDKNKSPSSDHDGSGFSDHGSDNHRNMDHGSMDHDGDRDHASSFSPADHGGGSSSDHPLRPEDHSSSSSSSSSSPNNPDHDLHRDGGSRDPAGQDHSDDLPPPHLAGEDEQYGCREDAHCPVYAYCHQRTCQTKFVHRNGGQSCLKLDKDGKSLPNHEKCRLTDAEISGVPIVFSTARCFKELNYNCARAFYMPCTANYDDDDKVVKGQEESCPNHFKCTSKKYGPDGQEGGREVKLCVPDKLYQEPKVASAEKHGDVPSPDDTAPHGDEVQNCGTNFDCGYEVMDADLDDGWAVCQASVCKKPDGF
jgi:hypothetical protein